MKAWIDTANDAEASARSREFWSGMRAELDAGAFWADHIKSFRQDAQARLQLALRNLPLSAAFREAAVALRSLIRAKRKAKQLYEEELAFLYWLAAIDSFSVPYSARLREPGFNVIESMPGAVIRNLSFDYARLGYERLALLNATDRKWIVESWGEPKAHSTLNEIHSSVWRDYEEKLLRTRGR